MPMASLEKVKKLALWSHSNWWKALVATSGKHYIAAELKLVEDKAWCIINPQISSGLEFSQ